MFYHHHHNSSNSLCIGKNLIHLISYRKRNIFIHQQHLLRAYAPVLSCLKKCGGEHGWGKVNNQLYLTNKRQQEPRQRISYLEITEVFTNSLRNKWNYHTNSISALLFFIRCGQIQREYLPFYQ